jgi:hypothetical protein
MAGWKEVLLPDFVSVFTDEVARMVSVGVYCFYPEERGITFVWNICTHQSDYIVS